jgi:hypothetical protein
MSVALALRFISGARRDEVECRPSRIAHAIPFPRPDSPGCFRMSPPSWKSRAQGRPGAGRARGPPAEKKQAAVTTGPAEHARPSLRDGLAAYTRSPWGPAVLPPSSARRTSIAANLASAPGCQDHAISPSHQVVRPREINPRCDPTRPPHPAPDVRDDREAPPLWDGMGRVDHYFGKIAIKIFRKRRSRMSCR